MALKLVVQRYGEGTGVGTLAQTQQEAFPHILDQDRKRPPSPFYWQYSRRTLVALDFLLPE